MNVISFYIEYNLKKYLAIGLGCVISMTVKTAQSVYRLSIYKFLCIVLIL